MAQVTARICVAYLRNPKHYEPRFAAGDGRLHANGKVFHLKGINWCVPHTPE